MALCKGFVWRLCKMAADLKGGLCEWVSEGGGCGGGDGGHQLKRSGVLL